VVPDATERCSNRPRDLSFANMLLAAVGAALGTSNTDRAVAEILRGVDMDAELAALLDAES
jgi:hypothetical protein